MFYVLYKSSTPQTSIITPLRCKKTIEITTLLLWIHRIGMLGPCQLPPLVDFF